PGDHINILNFWDVTDHGWFGTQQGSNHGFGNQVLGATDGNRTYKRFSSVNGQHVRHRCFLPSTPRSTLVARTDRVALTNWQCPYCRRRNLDVRELGRDGGWLSVWAGRFECVEG